MDAVFEPARIVVDGSGRLVIALVLGSFVGLQREIDDQPAGLRTHLTVCLGAALFGVISTLGFVEFQRISDVGAGGTNLTTDVTRVASQVVVGIGFLGAGIIIRRGDDVRNVTTAASIWSTAAIGLAAGVGNGSLAILATLFLLMTLAVLRLPRDWVRRRMTRQTRRIRVRIDPEFSIDAARTQLDRLDELDCRIVGVGKHDGMVEIIVEVQGEPGVEPGVKIAPLLDSPAVVEIGVVDDGTE